MASEPRIRPPQQRRSQESLERVLQAGFEVLRDSGLEGFTLQEVSQRSGVSIGSIYARVPSREALIMAIYENAMDWTTTQDEFVRHLELSDASPREKIEAITTEAAEDMLAHADILRVFMRQAAHFAEIWERGAAKSQASAKAFEKAVLQHRDSIAHPDPELAVDVAFRILYCTIARRITHGSRFESTRPLSEDKLIRELARVVADYLL